MTISRSNVMKRVVKAECESCGGTGVYCGFMESPGTAVVCLTCSGTGCERIRYRPFVRRRRRKNVKTVYVSVGKLIVCGGPRGTPVPYKDFLKGKLPTGGIPKLS
jgi:hypothetical protein